MSDYNPPTWVTYGRKNRLWVEDDATLRDPTAEHINDAWPRITGEQWDPKKALDRWEYYDETWYLFAGGWIACSACDGYGIFKTSPEFCQGVGR